MTKDPVCGMSVDSASPHTSARAGQTIAFCSATCKSKFDKEPDRYTSPASGDPQGQSRP